MEIWRGQQEGLNTIVINPGVILGPGFYENGSGEIFTKVKNGLCFYTKGSSGFVSVNDVIKIMVQLMKSEISGERFIAIAENISFENIMHTIAKAMKVKPPSIYAKPWLTEISWRLDWISSNIFLQKRKLSKSMAESLHTSKKISNEKVKNTLKYKFQNIEEYFTGITSLLKL